MIRYFCDNCKNEINEAQAKAEYPVETPSSGMNVLGDRYYCALIVRKDHESGRAPYICWDCAGIIFRAALAMYRGESPPEEDQT